MRFNPRSRAHAQPGSTGLARALSKLGYCSRSIATELIRAGKVSVNGSVCRDPLRTVVPGRERIEVEGQNIREPRRVFLALNKPRGLVTTRSDEKGRATVYACFEGHALPFVTPVGRLDQASEGLLFFTNDPAWGARITDPDSGIVKTYAVQIDSVPDGALLEKLRAGIVESGELLSARAIEVLRSGTRNAWLEITLDEGRNRHIRRMLAALGISVLRLVRVSIGPVVLGDLPKGKFRELTAGELSALESSWQPGKGQAQKGESNAGSVPGQGRQGRSAP